MAKPKPISYSTKNSKDPSQRAAHLRSLANGKSDLLKAATENVIADEEKMNLKFKPRHEVK